MLRKLFPNELFSGALTCCLQKEAKLLCLQTRHLWSPKTSPPHCPHRGGREAAAPVSTMPGGCLGRPQMSCLLTQQMSCLLTQQMSCLQTQQMSCLQTHFLRICPTQPQMVFGHNLQHMAPFGIPTSGFCMVFQGATLVFSTPEAILGVQDLDLGSGWAGDLFGQTWGPEKHDFVEDMVPHGV